MMKAIIFIACLAAVWQADGQQTVFPQADIGNGILKARIYLPDAGKGYYRSTRFDWSGVMPSLEYRGHQLFGQWFPKYDPTINDAIMGPVESFAPLGYEQAAAGGSFVMIGVGRVSRPDGSAYSPFRYYPILNAGHWDIKRSQAGIEFHHRLNDSVYSYDYRKTITLTRGKAQMVIAHRLINRGHRAIETDVFDHNFFMIDDRRVAPGRMLKFRFAPTPEAERGLGELAAIRGDSIVILRPFAAGESVYAILHGYDRTSHDEASRDRTANDYDIRLEDRASGTGIHITADQPLAKLVFWGSGKVLCPEPYIHVSVPPGGSFGWTISYEFYTLQTSDKK